MLLEYSSKVEFIYEISRMFIPGLINLAFFIITFIVIFSEKVVNAERKLDLEIVPVRYNLLGGMLCLSPLSLVSYTAITSVVTFNPSKLSIVFLPILTVSFFWIIVDIAKKLIFRYPANVLALFNLSLSWVVVSLVSRLFVFPMHKLWPILSITHAVMFTAVTFAASWVMPSGKAAEPTVPSSASAFEKKASDE